MPVRSNGWKSPNKAWGTKRDKTIERCHTFGCEAWYMVSKQNRRKGDKKARRGINLGTSDKHHGWKILDLETRKIVNSRDVYFFEHKFPFKNDQGTRKPGAVMEDNDDVVHFKSADNVSVNVIDAILGRRQWAARFA